MRERIICFANCNKTAKFIYNRNKMCATCKKRIMDFAWFGLTERDFEKLRE